MQVRKGAAYNVRSSKHAPDATDAADADLRVHVGHPPLANPPYTQRHHPAILGALPLVLREDFLELLGWERQA